MKKMKKNVSNYKIRTKLYIKIKNQIKYKKSKKTMINKKLLKN